MSGLDLGATVSAWIKANGFPISSPQVRQLISYPTYKAFVDSPDHLSKTFMDKVLGILNVYDAYLVYNIEGCGPFYPNQDDGTSHVTAIRYAMSLKGVTYMQLHTKTEIDFVRLERIARYNSNLASMRIYEAAIIFEALGITCFIMPKIKPANESMVLKHITAPKLMGKAKKQKTEV